MSLLIQEIGTYLATQMSRTVGTNLFYSKLPAEPADAIAVVDNGGSPSSNTVVEHRRIQVLVRHSAYSSGATNALSAYTKLHKKSAFLTTKTSYSVADALPIYLGVEESGLHTWSVNFTMTIKGS